MSAKELQEMENPVTRGAKPAESMPKLSEPTATGLASVEDLGGPTPENYKPDNDSAKLKPAAVKTVKDIVNRGAKGADAMQSIGTEVLKQGDEPEVEETQEVVAEQEVEETEAPAVDIEEDLAALFGGEELSEEFQSKARTIFEAAVTAKVTEVQEAMAAEYEAKITEDLETVKSELVELSLIHI